MKSPSQTSMFFLTVLALTLTACTPKSTATALPEQETAQPSPVFEAEATQPDELASNQQPEVEAGESASQEILPPDPQTIEFQAADGTVLQGTYYPAASASAPVVVLMHWARGDQSDWSEYARWMQNRGLYGDGLPLPSMPEGLSLAVFTFDFRGFGSGGRPAFNPDGWLQDALAAVETARSLPGVDPQHLVTIGASIGSDGAVDACGQGCTGALSFSPGSYLGVAYADAVDAIPDRPVWCLAAEGDAESAPTCRSAAGENFRAIIYPGSAHGMYLLQAGMDPDSGQILFDFLMITLQLQ